MDEGDTGDNDVEEEDEDKGIADEENDNDKGPNNQEETGSAWTTGKGKKFAQVSAHKLSAVQCVETNQKKIVDAGNQLKTLRAMKAEKKKREAAFYFINTEATIDKCAHWQELDCAVITDDVESDEPPVVKVSKG